MKDMSAENLVRQSRGFLATPTIASVDDGILVRGGFEMTAFAPELFDRLSIHRPKSLESAIAKRQAEFLAGRSMAAIAQSSMGLIPGPVEIGGNRAPVWPEGLAGSISHARGHCACFLVAQTHGHPGIDIETVTSGQALRSIERMVLQPQERAILGRGDMPLEVAATLIFSAKECLFKALHPVVQRHFGFAAAELRALPGVGRLTLCLTEALHPSLPRGAAFDICYHADSQVVLTWMVHSGSTAKTSNQHARKSRETIK